MKTNLFVNRTTVCMKSVILLCMALLLPSAIAGKGKNSQKKVISYVDTSLNGSQKYVLRVDCRTGIQYPLHPHSLGGSGTG